MIISAIIERFNILKINILNSFTRETSYFGNNIGNLLSTVFYSLALLLFIEVIYSNTSTFAGYTQNEMYFLFLIVQLNFYIDWMWSTNNLGALMDDVRSGNLDLVLTKPLPELFYISTKDFNILSAFKDGLPNIIILIVLIDWASLSVQYVFLGILIFLFGQLAWNCLRFMFAVPVFWLGDNRQFFSISGTFARTDNIPYEGFSRPLKIVFTAVVPILITSQLSVSVMLGKSSPFLMTSIAGLVALIFLSLKKFIWKIAVKNYTSASS